MKHIVPKALYALSLALVLILISGTGLVNIMGIAIILAPCYAFMVFTVQYHSKRRLLQKVVAVARVLVGAIIFLFIVSAFDTFKDCGTYAAICTNVSQIQMLLSASLLSFAAAVVTSFKALNKYFDPDATAKDMSDPVFERYESMTQGVYEQYISDNTEQLMSSIAQNRAITLISRYNSTFILGKKMDKQVQAHIAHLIASAIVDGYRLWLAEHLSREGSLPSTTTPDYSIYAEQWDTTKFKRFNLQPKELQDVAVIVHKDRYRAKQRFIGDHIPKTILSQLKRLDVGLINIGINIAQYDNTYRTDEAEQKVEELNKEQKSDIVNLLKGLRDKNAHMYLAGDFGLDLLIDNEMNFRYWPIFIADIDDAVDIRKVLRELGCKVELSSDSRLSFTLPGKNKKLWVSFYTTTTDPDRYFFGSVSSNIEYRGTYQHTVEHEGNVYEVASPLFYIQNMNYQLAKLSDEQKQNGSFGFKTALDSLLQIYYPGASSSEERFNPIDVNDADNPKNQWSDDIFGGDDVGDFIAELETSETVDENLRAAFDNVLKRKYYLELPEASIGVAAAVLVACRFDKDLAVAYPQVAELLTKLPSPDKDLIKLASSVLQRITDKTNNEWYELWRESANHDVILDEINKAQRALELK